jgi:hypothetical protein
MKHQILKYDPEGGLQDCYGLAGCCYRAYCLTHLRQLAEGWEGSLATNKACFRLTITYMRRRYGVKNWMLVD